MQTRKNSRHNPDTNTWRCPGCERWLSRYSFSQRSRNQDGIADYCKQCSNAKSRKYYQARKAKH